MDLLNLESIHCADCGELTPDPHQGRCFACNLKRVRGEPLPENARCTQCGEMRRRVLGWFDFGRDRVLLCHNCNHLGLGLKPRPQSFVELSHRLQREVWSEEQRLAYYTGLPRSAVPEIEDLVADLALLSKVL